MKKIIFTLVLMLSIIICVTGCSSNTSGNISNKDLNGAYTQISKDEVKEQSTSVITITINPEFKLFLDGEKRIIAVKCLNKDAESIYNEIELLGHVYEAGLNLIVEKAVEKNFITSSSKINIELVGVNGTLSAEDKDQYSTQTQNVISQLSQSHNIAIDLELKADNEVITPDGGVMAPPSTPDDGVIEPPSTPDVNGGDSNPTYPIVEQEFDENGNLIREIIHQEDGSFEHIDYNTEGYIIQYQAYDSNNICHTEYTREYLSTSPLKYKECYNGENFDITCDENGNIVVRGYYGTSVEYYIEEHLQDGVVVSSTTTLTDGRISQKEFVDGVITKETMTYETGLVEVSEYKDGIIIKKNSHDTEGMRWEYDYTDGEMTQEIRYSPDGTTDTTRYKNGIKTFYSYVFTDGTYELKHFNENGLVTYIEGYSTVYKEGHKTTFTVGSNGLYTYSIYEHTDGYVEEIFYDANGNKESWKSVHTDGSKHHGIFDANGSYIEQ